MFPYFGKEKNFSNQPPGLKGIGQTFGPVTWAEVKGYSLEPISKQNLYDIARIDTIVDSEINDIEILIHFLQVLIFSN